MCEIIPSLYIKIIYNMLYTEILYISIALLYITTRGEILCVFIHALYMKPKCDNRNFKCLFRDLRHQELGFEVFGTMCLLSRSSYFYTIPWKLELFSC